MSIASKLDELQQDITNANSSIIAKGGSVATGSGSAQLANNINSIPTGSSGYKLYVKMIYSGTFDEGMMQINDEPAFKMTDSNGTHYAGGSKYVQIPDKVQKFRLWGFDHRGTYPTTASSWARYKLHDSTVWTSISLSRYESDANYIVLTGDTDLEIYEGTCLNKGTLITMADGTKKPVEDIDEGDYVLSYNGRALRVNKSEKGNKAYNDNRDVWNFEGGYQIITTFQHRFYNYENQKMMYLQEWNIGEHAVTEDGEKVALLKHIHEDIPCQYFSLWCDEENYFAGGLLAGNRYTEQINIQ